MEYQVAVVSSSNYCCSGEPGFSKITMSIIKRVELEIKIKEELVVDDSKLIDKIIRNGSIAVHGEYTVIIFAVRYSYSILHQQKIK